MVAQGGGRLEAGAEVGEVRLAGAGEELCEEPLGEGPEMGARDPQKGRARARGRVVGHCCESGGGFRGGGAERFQGAGLVVHPHRTGAHPLPPCGGGAATARQRREEEQGLLCEAAADLLRSRTTAGVTARRRVSSR